MLPALGSLKQSTKNGQLIVPTLAHLPACVHHSASPIRATRSHLCLQVLVCAQSNAAVDELVTRLDAQVCSGGPCKTWTQDDHCRRFLPAPDSLISNTLLSPLLFTGSGARQKARLVRMGKLESFSTTANRRFHIDAQAAEYATRGDSSVQGGEDSSIELLRSM